MTPVEGAGRLSVLVVDGGPGTAGRTAALLARHGHQACVAGCGAEALRAAEAHRPDVVLLDLRLPDLDGWEVARRLRALAGKPSLVVAVAPDGRDEDHLRSNCAGIDLHLVKPVESALLVGLLRRFRRALVPSGWTGGAPTAERGTRVRDRR